MNVTLIPDTFFPLFSGAEMHVYALAKQLIKRGVNVRILTRNVPELRRKIDNLTINGFPSMFGSYHKYMRGYWLPLFDPLLSLMPIFYGDFFKKSIIHAHGPIALSIIPHKIRSSFPFILTIHDFWPICFQRGLLSRNVFCNLEKDCCKCLSLYMGKLSYFANIIMRMNALLIKSVDKFIAVSHFVKDMLIKGGIPAKKIDVVYN